MFAHSPSHNASTCQPPLAADPPPPLHHHPSDATAVVADEARSTLKRLPSHGKPSVPDDTLATKHQGKVDDNIFGFIIDDSVSLPALRAVLRFRVENEGGKVNERRRDELFRPVDVAEDFTNSGSHFLGLNISAASVIAEGMGGQLGIAQHPSGTSFARLWVDLPLISNS